MDITAKIDTKRMYDCIGQDGLCDPSDKHKCSSCLKYDREYRSYIKNFKFAVPFVDLKPSFDEDDVIETEHYGDEE